MLYVTGNACASCIQRIYWRSAFPEQASYKYSEPQYVVGEEEDYKIQTDLLRNQTATNFVLAYRFGKRVETDRESRS